MGKDSYKADSPTWDELDEIRRGRSDIDLAEMIWRLLHARKNLLIEWNARKESEKRQSGPNSEPPSFKKLAEVHRGWCNFCQGNVTWCRNAPEGGCSLRDCEREIDPTLFATKGEGP